MHGFIGKATLAALIALGPIGAFAQHGHGKGDDHGHKQEHQQKKPEHREPTHQATRFGHAMPPTIRRTHVDQGRHLGWQKQAERERHDADRARERREAQERARRQWELEQRRRHPAPVRSLYHERQETKNEWRNLAIASGLIGVVGLLEHDKTLVFAGSAGTLYSLYRYEEDRKSQSNLARARAFYFSKPYFVRNGHRYNRRTVTKGGQRYYQFVRG